MLYIYNIEERHKHNDFKLTKGSQLATGGEGLERVDVRKGSDSILT